MIAGGFLNLYNAKKQPNRVAFFAERVGFLLTQALRDDEPEGSHPSL